MIVEVGENHLKGGWGAGHLHCIVCESFALFSTKCLAAKETYHFLLEFYKYLDIFRFGNKDVKNVLPFCLQTGRLFFFSWSWLSNEQRTLTL